VGDSREGWAAALVDLIDTFMTDDHVEHENRVYDVTNVRPKGARLKTFGGTASGPAPFAKMLHDVAAVLNGTNVLVDIRSWPGEVVRSEKVRSHPLTCIEAMEIDHAIAQCVVAGGVRRSARMAMVHWQDPHIFDFISCKSDFGDHFTTNISVIVDDDFMLKLSQGDQRAKDIHEACVEGMLANGEPGYFNISLANEGELDEIYATNPCGEITLHPWENCVLGHVNLDAFATDPDNERLEEAHRLMIRFLIRATFADVADPKSREIQDKNRRVGVGHTGVQGYLAKKGIRLSQFASKNEHPSHTANFKRMLEQMASVVDREARDYAFELRVPTPVKTRTVAPTGTISKMPGVSEGIHPVYAKYFNRRIRFSSADPDQAERLRQYEVDGYHVEPCIYSANTSVVTIPTKELLVQQVEELGYDADVVESVDEIGLYELLAFQAMYQKLWADNAVSFTANIPEGKYSTKEVGDILQELLPYLKGTTLMPDGTRPQAPYERLTREQYELISAGRQEVVEDSVDEDCATGACPIR